MVILNLWWIPLASAIWVFADASSICKRGGGTKVGGNTPAVWAVVTFFVWIIGFPVYLVQRREAVTGGAAGNSEGGSAWAISLVRVVGAVVAILVLAAAGLWSVEKISRSRQEARVRAEVERIRRQTAEARDGQRFHGAAQLAAEELEPWRKRVIADVIADTAKMEEEEQEESGLGIEVPALEIRGEAAPPRRAMVGKPLRLGLTPRSEAIPAPPPPLPPLPNLYDGPNWRLGLQQRAERARETLLKGDDARIDCDEVERYAAGVGASGLSARDGAILRQVEKGVDGCRSGDRWWAADQLRQAAAKLLPQP